jgi:hypothetical protein
MADDAELTAKRGRKPQARKFYVMDPSFTGGRPGFRIENEQTLRQSQYARATPPEVRGFPSYPEPPRVLIGNKLGRPLRDLEVWNGEYTLISERLKRALESTDPDGCEFVRCEVRLATGEPGQELWLCDVLRILDALDESVSRLKIHYESGRKKYSITGGASLVFKDEAVGPAHIFRMAHLWPVIVCDQQMTDACKAAGAKGIKFKDAANC